MRSELVATFDARLCAITNAQDGKRQLRDTMYMRAVARGRRVLAATTSGAAKQRCASNCAAWKAAATYQVLCASS